MRAPWAYRYQATIIGCESGNVTPLIFVQFRTLRRAQQWVIEMNQSAMLGGRRRPDPPLTRYGFQEIM